MQRGAKATQESAVKYWNFSKGQFTRRVSENHKGATPRVLEQGPNTGKTIHEIFMDQVTGQIVEIKVREGDYGKSFQILIDVTEDEQSPEFFAVDFRFNSTGKSLLKKLPNIDLTKDVALVGYAIDGTNSKGEAVTNYYAVPYQGEISKAGKVLPAYTMEEPNGYPEMKKIKVKGKNTWDDTDQLEFLENLINSIKWEGQQEQEAPEAVETPEIEDEETEEVPF